MAELEGLYFGMGIDTSQLHSDFVEAEKTINQNLARINNEMKLVQLRGQVQLEGLDESASSAEKLRIQEEALTEQINLQQDKIILLAGTYQHLVETRGESAETTKQVEAQLAREQLAMQRLQHQIDDLSKQEEIAIGFNLELLGLIEPAWKAIDMAVASGRTLPIPVPYAKAAAAASTGLLALAEGSREATEELREENPAKILDESFKQAAISIDDSWQQISDRTQRGTVEMQAHVKNATTAFSTEMQKHAEQVKSQELKIFPEINEGDFTRFLRVIEDYRASESAVNALELIKQSESVIGTLLSVVTGIGYATMKIDVSSIQLAQTSIDSFKGLTQAAKELNIPLERASDFMSKISLAGADYNDVRDYVRGVQDAVIKGDSEDPEVIALEKYGVVIQDNQGKLLAFDETLDRLYQGYLKAREAGEAEAYVIMTNGQAVQDVLPYFENLAKTEEDMAKIKWSTIDFATLSETSRNMKLVEMQTDELKNALSSLAVPAANIALENTFEKFKRLTEIVEENRDEVIYWSFVLMEGVNSLQNFAKGLGGDAKDKLIEFGESLVAINEKVGLTDFLKNFFQDEPKKPIEEEAKEYFIPFYNELKQLEEEFGAISKLEGFLPKGFTQEIDSAINGYLVPLYQTIKNIKEEFSITNKLKSFLPDDLFSGAEEVFDSIFIRAKKDMEEFKKANEDARKEIKKARDESAGLSYSWNRIAKYKAELEKIKFDIQFGDGYSYQKLAAQNKLWYEEAMKDAKQYANEIAILDELYAAKSEQIEQEKEQKLAEIRERITAADKTELEKRIADIEREKQTWIQAGMEKAEAEQLAQKQLSDYLNSTRQELSDKVQSLYQTELENRLLQIEQEKQAWIDKCADEVKATELAEQQKADAQRQAAMSVIKQQAKEYEAYQKGGFVGLQEYKLAELLKSGVNPNYLNMTAQQLADFQKANQIAEKGLLPNFMTDRDKADFQNLWNQSFQKIKEKYDSENYAINSKGERINLSEIIGGTPIKIDVDGTEFEFKPESRQAIQRNYETDENGKAYKMTEKEFSLPAIEGVKSFSEMSTVVQIASDSLNQLPVMVSGMKETFTAEVSQLFSPMSEPLTTVTVKFADLSTALDSFLSQLNSASTNQSQPQPVAVNNTISIEEAHAWDYNHIQELAEKVAEIITPTITRAIGGDSNSY